MRDFKELDMSESKNSISLNEIREAEQLLSIALPDDYLSFITQFNGGHSNLTEFNYPSDDGGEASSSIDTFFHITLDKEDSEGVIWATIVLREILEDLRLPNEEAIVIGESGGGNMVYLDLSNKGYCVRVYYCETVFGTPKVAEDFTNLIDKLYVFEDW